METEDLISKVKESNAHPDVIDYIKKSKELGLGSNMVLTLELFAKENDLDSFSRTATPVETEIWENGVQRLHTDPQGEPYGASPDQEQEQVIAEIYTEKYS